jgi:hypothetical protein
MCGATNVQIDSPGAPAMRQIVQLTDWLPPEFSAVSQYTILIAEEDASRRLLACGIDPDRVVLRRDMSPVEIDPDTQPLAGCRGSGMGLGGGNSTNPSRLRDRLGEMATRRLLDALGMARQAVISAQTQVKVAGPSVTPAKWSRERFDALAHLITGSPYYFHAQGTVGPPGEPNRSRGRSAPER